ncbi:MULTISPECIES: SixA phosphatase family protein [Alphaproteobacteria]|uniref:Phosphoglycerate mutase n=2 Tax=Alphaproteobacteria TaxID=28211 RepID=A0A512HK87_9HYPH|nr:MULTISPECIES: histidine phosphatase family protein [Alphaproteobacteria]GEO85855.1 phosphoglycerate mutase [Ciceribacter naphthalenivorans]GLR21711.1 phosphoglycerate mutase [Ciceribacter naphthalenivorans]GLT04567.1 phosphoglycerate mutase [Sphingomonas psychrolutea]
MASSQADRPAKRQGLRLLLLRHAKSAWPDGVADEERPLNARGRASASMVGDYLAREGLVPDLALVSSARRTRETWALVGECLPRTPKVRQEPGLYAASAEDMLGVLRRVEAIFPTVLILAHNPGTQDLALLLSGAGEKSQRREIGEKYPTAGLAVIDFGLDDWGKVGAGAGFLERFVTPRMLG